MSAPGRGPAVELAPLVKTLEVRRSAAEAFRLFTEEMTAWWPLATHTLAKDAQGEKTVAVVFEPRVGGRIYERLSTGAERDWGEVLAFDPGRRVRFAFQMGRPKETSGEVEVRFEPLGDARCRVTLIHENWERFGDEAEAMRGRFERGWQAVLVQGFGGFAGKRK